MVVLVIDNCIAHATAYIQCSGHTYRANEYTILCGPLIETQPMLWLVLQLGEYLIIIPMYIIA